MRRVCEELTGSPLTLQLYPNPNHNPDVQI